MTKRRHASTDHIAGKLAGIVADQIAGTIPLVAIHGIGTCEIRDKGTDASQVGQGKFSARRDSRLSLPLFLEAAHLVTPGLLGLV